MNLWNFFARKVCLTLGPDWPTAQEEFARVRLEGVQRLDALPIDDEILGPHQSFSASVRKGLSEFYESGDETLLFLEDDCIFVHDVEHVETAFCELPNDWDIIYLGANLMNGSPHKFSERLHRVDHAWTTHAVGFNRKVVPFLLENQPPLNEEMFDTYMSRQLPNLNAFVVNPVVS